ncbi:hypothetical protein Q3G72_016621 [Acer saccharum]|nr:hypothetical protein Q3G72_016621 [Acer saccharum]
MVDLLGVGDLSPSNEDDMGLREADRLDRNVPFALSGVPATNAVAPTRRTRLRFMSSRRRGVTMQRDNLLYDLLYKRQYQTIWNIDLPMSSVW